MEVQRTPKEARRESPRNDAERSIEDRWEDSRQELAARGDIFDAKGNVTKGGQEILVKSGWGMRQILQMEDLQRNHAAPVEIIRLAEPTVTERVSSGRSAESERMAADARVRAQQELADRVGRDAEVRNRTLGRQQAGVRAYMDAVRNNRSDADAERAKQTAEDAFDRQYQQTKERHAA